MLGKIISTVVLSLFGIGAIAEFIIVQHSRFDQLGFFFLLIGVSLLCVAVVSWRHWEKIHEAYTYRRTAERDGVELPQLAWSERLGMGAIFNLRNQPQRQHSNSGSN
jgi:hypothetical protein